jgi:signal transduction histidine kinase
MLADSNRLLTTVEQVLQASRTRENHRQLNITEIELNHLLAESIGIVKTRHNLDEAAVKFNESAEAAVISGDKSELQTVFINLLDNAVKYSGDDPKISVRIKNTSEKKVEIFIKDNGIGLESGELKRIFKRFYRVANTETQEKKGTGLGLFIVQSIIKKHSGKIWADSKGKGKGSTFIVQIPKNS